MSTFCNKIVNGDSLLELKKIPNKTFDLVFADPPYNMQIGETLRRPDASKVKGVDDKWDQFDSFKHYDDFCKAWLIEIIIMFEAVELIPFVINTFYFTGIWPT